MNNQASKARFTVLNFAIAIFFLTTPLESIAVFDNFSITKLSAIIVVAGWIWQGFKVNISTSLRLFLLLALYASFSILWSIDIDVTIKQVFSFLWPSIFVALAMSGSIRKREDIVLYLGAYVIGCLIACVDALIFRNIVLAEAQFVGEERLTAFGQDQNTLAFLLCMAIVFIVDSLRNTSNKIRILMCVLMIFILILVILSTGSRTGLIIAAIILALYLISIRNFKYIIILGAFIVIVVPLIDAFIPESIWERFSETNELVDSGDFSNRGSIWKYGLSAFAEENMIFGVGYSNFGTMLQRHFGWQGASHNTYLSYLVDLGLVGLILFITILIRMMKIVLHCYNARKNPFIFAYYIPFLAVMFVLETEYKRWIFIIGILLEAYYRLEFKEKPRK